MRKQKTYITPEVVHLLAAVKAVKDGLVPERQSQPVHDQSDTERDGENEVEEPEK